MVLVNIRQYAKRILFGAENFPDNPYKKSQDYFVIEAICANGMGVLAGGVFLTGFALWLGASDYLVGIMLSLPLFTNFLQLLSALIYEKMERRKTLIVILTAAYRFLVTFIIFIPLILPKDFWVPALFVMILLGYGALSLYASATNNWIISLVPQKYRGRYFSRRESIFQAVGMVVSLAVGGLVDLTGRTYYSFCIAFGLAILFAAGNIFVLTKIEEPPVDIDKTQRLKLRQLFTIPLHNKPYMYYVIYWMIWNLGLWIAAPFFSVYMIKTLELSYTYMTVLSTVSLISLIVAVRLWGKYADNHSWGRTLIASTGVLCIVYLMWCFVSPHTVLLLFPLHILNGIGYGGMNIASFNAVFRIIPEKNKTVFLGFLAAFSGLAGFLGPLLGGKLIDIYNGLLQAYQINWLYDKQLLFATAFLVMIGAFLFGKHQVNID